MTRRLFSVSLLLAPLSALAKNPPASLEEVMQERKPDKRSEKALDFAEFQMDQVGEAYAAHGWTAALNHLKQVQEASELAYKSLEETGKNPRKSKHHKKAEIRTRRLVRELRDFDNRLLLDERPEMEPVLRRLREIHEDLLAGVMGLE